MNLTDEQRQFFKEKFRQLKEDIQYFAEFFFPHLLNRASAPFQKEIYRDLAKAYPFSAYEVFRGGGKSTIGLIIKPIHFALFKPIGDISLISKSESFVLNEINRKIKAEFENNVKLIQFFGNQKTEKWSESYFVLKNGIAFELGKMSEFLVQDTVFSIEKKTFTILGKMVKGLSKFVIPEKLSEKHTVLTDNAAACIEGTTFYVESGESGDEFETTVYVEKGNVSLYELTGGKSVLVGGGKKSTVWGRSAPTKPEKAVFMFLEIYKDDSSIKTDFSH